MRTTSDMDLTNTGLRPASWQQIWRDNRLFLLLFGLIWALSYGIYLSIGQGEDILFLNQRRTDFGDLFFQYATMLGEAPAFLLVGFLLARRSLRHLLTVPLIGLAATLVAAALKNYFDHLRPFPWFQANGMEGLLQTIEGVHINMGANSFPSGHTMAAFALFAFLFLCLPKAKKSPLNALLLLALPLVAGISRIYLLKHFLKDVLLGALIGLLLAILLYRLQYVWPPYPHRRLDQGWSWLARKMKKEATEKP